MYNTIVQTTCMSNIHVLILLFKSHAYELNYMHEQNTCTILLFKLHAFELNYMHKQLTCTNTILQTICKQYAQIFVCMSLTHVYLSCQECMMESAKEREEWEAPTR